MSDEPAVSPTFPRKTASRLDYDSAIRRASSLVDFERSSHNPGHSRFHLERMSLLMERLGSPHLGVPTVHIAGTNGKGSTAAMITSMLSAQGYKTGLYTSPSLHSPTERIRVGLQPIDRREFASLVNEAWDAVEWVGSHGGYGGVSYFELLTAMGFLHFKRIGADFQVIEVGLGGRLDATNVVDPEVCVITRISKDHVGVLGDTLTLIATEKAGIIKHGVPVVVAPQYDEPGKVFREIASKRTAPLTQVGRQIGWRKLEANENGQSFVVDGRLGSYTLWTPLLGDYQQENAATAVATAETLIGRGYELTAESIEAGAARVRWPARLQRIPYRGKLVVVDGAHNQDGMRRAVEAIREIFSFRNVFLVFGVLRGHSAKEMLGELACLSPGVIATSSREPRAALTDSIIKAATEQDLQVVFRSEGVGGAVRWAVGNAREDDLVLAIGSLSVAAEAIEELDGIVAEKYDHIERPSSPR